jgi:hypothetical protein
MTCNTLTYLHHLSRPGDYFVSLDLADGSYTLGIRGEDRENSIVNYRGELWRLACLPTGWLGSAYCFCKLTQVLTNYLRRPQAAPPTTTTPLPLCLLKLPYMNDFLFLAASFPATLIEIEIVYNVYRVMQVAVFGPSQL